jgi:hypothetical protein
MHGHVCPWEVYLIVKQIFLQANIVLKSGLLLMVVTVLMLPAVLHFTRSELQQGAFEVSFSRFSSCIMHALMLVAYASYFTSNQVDGTILNKKLKIICQVTVTNSDDSRIYGVKSCWLVKMC